MSSFLFDSFNICDIVAFATKNKRCDILWIR